MIRYHGEPYIGSDDHANDLMRSKPKEKPTVVKKTDKIAVVVPESFITDAARPLLAVCEQLIGYPQAKRDVQRAREYIEKAMTFLDKAYSDVR